jgi:hypothetical protein
MDLGPIEPPSASDLPAGQPATIGQLPDLLGRQVQVGRQTLDPKISLWHL